MMLKQGKIGPQEAWCACALAVTGKLAFVKWSYSAYNTSWYGVLCTGIFAVFLIVAAFLLLRLTGQPDLHGAFRRVFGQLGRIFPMLIGAVTIFALGGLMNEFVRLLSQYIYFDSPLWLVTGVLVATVMICAWMGMEAITRASKIMMLVFFVVTALAILGVMGEFDVSRLHPMLGDGIKNTLGHSTMHIIAFVDIIGLMLVGRSMQGKNHLRKACVKATATAIVISAALLLTMTLLFGYSLTENMVSPIYRITNIIGTEKFYQRFDAVIVFLWLATLLTGMAFSFYCAANHVARAFDIRDIRPILPPIALSLYYFVIAINDPVGGDDVIYTILNQYCWLLIAVPLALALIFGLIKKDRLKEYAADN